MSDKKTTSWPHQDLMAQSNVTAADLPEKTQKKIAKFATVTDDDVKESLDETIFGEIEDFIEKRDKEAKSAATKAKRDEFKKKAADDVSTAATAAQQQQQQQQQTPPTPTENKPAYKKMMGW